MQSEKASPHTHKDLRHNSRVFVNVLVVRTGLNGKVRTESKMKVLEILGQYGLGKGRRHDGMEKGGRTDPNVTGEAGIIG